MMINPHSNVHKTFTNRLPFRKKTIETRIIKIIFNKNEKDVGMSKPKNYANKFGRLT